MKIGKRCGASYISSSYVCRLENGYPELEKIKGAAGYPKIEKAVQNFESSLENVHPESQQVWRNALNEWMLREKKNKLVFPYDELDKEKAGKTGADRVAISIDEMRGLMDNYPETINIDNFRIPAPTDLVPKYSDGGQPYLCDPIFGEKMVRRTHNGLKEIEQEGKGASYSVTYLTGEAQAMLSFKSAREAAGLPWPMTPKQVSKEEIDGWASKMDLTPLKYVARKAQLIDHYRDPANSKERERNIVEAWLTYDGLSLTTGRQVAISRVMDKVGGIRTTVDHSVAFKNFVKKGLTGKDLALAAENPGNLNVVETNLNVAKKAMSWGETANKLAAHQPQLFKTISDYAARENFPTAPRSHYSKLTGEKNPSWEDRNSMSSAQWKHRQALAKTYRDRIDNPPGAPKVNLSTMVRPAVAPTLRSGKTPAAKPPTPKPEFSAKKKEKGKQMRAAFERGDMKLAAKLRKEFKKLD